MAQLLQFLLDSHGVLPHPLRSESAKMLMIHQVSAHKFLSSISIFSLLEVIVGAHLCNFYLKQSESSFPSRMNFSTRHSDANCQISDDISLPQEN
jgi:hypothetical protein